MSAQTTTAQTTTKKAFTCNLVTIRSKKSFAEVRHAKPAASRAESAETYVVAKGFRAGA